MFLFLILSPKYTARHGSKSCLAFKTIFYISSNLQSSPASSLCSSALWSVPTSGLRFYLTHMTLMVMCFGILAAIGASLSKIIHNSFRFSQISCGPPHRGCPSATICLSRAIVQTGMTGPKLISFLFTQLSR